MTESLSGSEPQVLGFRFHIQGPGFRVEVLRFRVESASHRGKSREWGRLKAKVEPLLNLGNSGLRQADCMPTWLWRGPPATRKVDRRLPGKGE